MDAEEDRCGLHGGGSCTSTRSSVVVAGLPGPGSKLEVPG